MAAWVTLHEDGWTRRGGIIGIGGEPCHPLPSHFDSIVSNLHAANGYWSAASDASRGVRSPDVTEDGVVSEKEGQQVFIAATYSQTSVQLYRNGAKYGNNHSVGPVFYTREPK